METFDHSVRLGVVARCTVSDNAKLITQIIPQFGFELSPSISGDSGWGTKTSDSPAEKSIGDRFCFNIYDWYSFRPTRETIDTSQ